MVMGKFKVQTLFCLLIQWYQRHISSHFLHKQCRFTPTCSNYAYEAIQRFGVLKGGFLSIARLLRCNPFFPGGNNPVPHSLTKAKEKLYEN